MMTQRSGANRPVMFGLLGPLEIRIHDRPVPIGGQTAQSLLAALLVDAGQVVPVSRLVEAMWADDPPATAHTQVRNRVSTLRRQIRTAGYAGEIVDSVGSGYVIRVAEGQRDIDIFEDRVRRAERLCARGDAPGAIGQLSDALALWRGPALDGLGSPALIAAARRLDERRLAVVEQRIDLEIGLDNHRHLVGELIELIDAHPWRERLISQLMLVLYRQGRQGDALQHFEKARQRLVDDLGIDPGSELVELRDRILRNDTALLAVPAGGSVPPAPVPGAMSTVTSAPRELPADVAGFAGRAPALKALDGLLPASGDDGQRGMVIAMITGTGGVGKTALALRWAHQVAERFPDGQLYINLCGYGPGRPVAPLEALAHLLSSLGVPGERIPPEESDASSLYRSLLAGRRVLLLVDNARSADQVRPLLPGSPECLVVVTSRNQLRGLVARDGAHPVNLDVLDRDDAITLLESVVGPERTGAEPTATANLTKLCGYLPLALRIAGAHLACGAPADIGAYVAGLADGNRLSALEIDDDGETAVRTVIHYSYEAAGAPERRLLRLLSLHPGRDFAAPDAAALADITVPKAATLLRRLAGTHLLQGHRAGRYTFHELLRLYARERVLSEESQAGRNAATRRLFDWYLRIADAAARLLYPQVVRLPPTATTMVSRPFTSHANAIAWLDAERANLVAVSVTAAHGQRRTAWLLADALRGDLTRRADIGDWSSVARAALTAAVKDGEHRGAATAHNSLGLISHRLGRNAKAIRQFERAGALSTVVGWTPGRASAGENMALVHRTTGRLHRAWKHHAEALSMFRAVGDRGGEVRTLEQLGLVYLSWGLLDRAAERQVAAHRIYRELGSLSGEAACLGNLGVTHHLLGQVDPAWQQLNRALELTRQLGDRLHEARVLVGLSLVHRDSGRYREAVECARVALTQAGRIGDRIGAVDALHALGSARYEQGDHHAALRDHQAALVAGRDCGYPYGLAQTRIALATTRLAAGCAPEAQEQALRAVRLARQGGFRI
ncbi:MAG TPA: BTAD domain-containing putative transcriptional regulator, partial [Catenuloplanes sp.]